MRLYQTALPSISHCQKNGDSRNFPVTTNGWRSGLYLDKTLLDIPQPNLQAFSLRNRRQLNLHRQECRTLLKQPTRCQNGRLSPSSLQPILTQPQDEAGELAIFLGAASGLASSLTSSFLLSDVITAADLLLSRRDRICWNIWTSSKLSHYETGDS